MKFDRHGIRFRFWVSYFILSTGIVCIIGLLQIGLVRPYYRNEKIHAVRFLAETIVDDLITNATDESIEDALQQTVNNNACVVIYNREGVPVYRADSLGSGCIFNANKQYSQTHAKDMIATLAMRTAEDEYSVNLVNELTDTEMVLYGKKVEANLGDYFVYINSPLQPVDSIVTFFLRHYLTYTFVAIALGSIAAVYLANRVTEPIVRIRKEASKLARADYSASFDGGDVTETVDLAATLNTATEKLSKIESLRKDLMANVSHDIKTPITNIKAYAEMIIDVSGSNEEKRNQHLSVIIREADYMNRLVNDMSQLSAMSTGNYSLKYSVFDLSEKIRQMIEMNGVLIETGELNVINEVREPIMVYADEFNIGRMIANYLSNAIKHTMKGKCIYLRAFEHEGMIRFEVEDEGEGISEKDLPFIWDRYQKSSRTFSRSQTSTGLGLSIVKAIADTHETACGVRSEEGKGSCFWFDIQKAEDTDEKRLS